MPAIVDKIKIANKELDKRVKLSDADRQAIQDLAEIYSRRELARLFNVSRRTIQYVLNPQSLEDNKQRRLERGGSKAYYDKKKHKETTQRHREYKKKLLREGKIG